MIHSQLISHTSLDEHLQAGPYQAYSYSYPHKSAYRHFAEPHDLHALWQKEPRDALFAYIHIPFCTVRCGFCNLFAMAQPQGDLVESYVQQVIAQMHAASDYLGKRKFARLALGGGTPSFLSAAQLAQIYEASEQILGIDLAATPSGIEVSPETVSHERLVVCKSAGVDRVSMGVQSFSSAETRQLARPQQNRVVQQAIDVIRGQGFRTLNLDLIYGIAGQTLDSWLASLDSALAFAPEELYLYPLYIRQQTGLEKIAMRQSALAQADVSQAQHSRPALYAAARDRLLAAGYRQISMRMFRAPHAPADDGPVYCCQNDGMVGLGAGARSYTRQLHYSSSYAVHRSATRQIVEDYIAQDGTALRQARYGFVLDLDEQRRRFLMQSLLTLPGLSRADYATRFGSDMLADFPQLLQLQSLDLLCPLADEQAGQTWQLNERGVALSDSIGPWLISPEVQARMQAPVDAPAVPVALPMPSRARTC